MSVFEFAAPKRKAHERQDEASSSQVQPSSAPSGPGHPLYTDLRASMEARFGHDFSQVRVHDDQESAAAADNLGAAAYTTGSDIVFSAGRYQPDTATGRGLVAHELAHVVQQAGSPPAMQSKAGDPPVTAPHDPSERAADAAAEAVLSGRSPVMQQRTDGLALQRAPVNDNRPAAASAEEDPRFDGFPPVLEAGLQYAEQKALEVLDRMVVELLPWLASPETQIAFAEQFRTLNPNRILLVIQILRRVREELPTVRYVYDENGEVLAHTIPLIGPIFICPPFFAEHDVASRYNTLIHEAAHRFACRLDLGYAFNEHYDEFGVLRQIWNAEPYGELAQTMGAQPKRTP